MPHQLTLKRETNKQYKLVRRAKVHADLARHRLQLARAESIAQVHDLDQFFIRKYADHKLPTLPKIDMLINHHLRPLIDAKKVFSSPEAKNDPDNILEIAAMNIHIAGWNWLNHKWITSRLPKR